MQLHEKDVSTFCKQLFSVDVTTELIEFNIGPFKLQEVFHYIEDVEQSEVLQNLTTIFKYMHSMQCF